MINIKTILLIGLTACSAWVNAQKYYEKQIGWTDVQDIHKIKVQNDTSFIVFGNYSAFPNNVKVSGYAMKINLQADSICRHFYEDTNDWLGILDAIENENGYAIPLNVYVNDQTTYIALLLVDSCGLPTLRTNYISPLGNTNCYTITRTFDKGYLIGGDIYPPDVLDFKPYLAKFDSLGNVQWEQAYTNVPKDGIITDILPAVDSSGYFVLSSYNYDDLDYTLQTRITKINNNGDSILLDKIYNFETDYYTGAKIEYDYDGNIMMGGVRHPYGYKSYVAKLDGTTLDTIWVNRNKAGGCVNIIPLIDGNYIIGNCDRNYNYLNLNTQAVIYKLSADGQIQWYRHYGGEGADYCYDITASPDGGYVMVGRTDTLVSNGTGGFNGLADIYIVKTNCMGLLTLPQANFTYSYDTTALVANFYNLSQYTYPDSIDGGYYLWNFGDGTTLTQTSDSLTNAHFTHLYNKNEPHLVTLTAIVCNDTSTYQQTLGLWAVGTNNTLPNKQWMQLYPNPAQNELRLYYQPQQTDALPASLSIKDFAGTTIYQTQLPTAGSYSINTSTWATGMYFCEISQANATPITQKVLIVR